jgi:hypothetical protein
MGEIGQAQQQQKGACQFQPGKKKNIGGSSCSTPQGKNVKGENFFKVIFLATAVGMLFMMEEIKEFFVHPPGALKPPI